LENPHKLKLFILLIPVIFLFQGCIEITEEITVHDDGSGSLSLSVGADANPLMLLLGQYADVNLADDFKKEARITYNLLKSQKGINNVNLSQNRFKTGMQLSFDFEDDDALNDALYAVSGVEKTFWQPDIVKIRKHKFVRKNTTGFLLHLLEEEKDNIPDEALFELVKVKSIYHIPAKAKRVRSSMELKSSGNDQTFTTSHFLSDLVDDKINTKIKIKY